MVREAADRIEVELSIRPTECGILVHPRIREIAVPPLYALYSVREDDRVVEVSEEHLRAARERCRFLL